VYKPIQIQKIHRYFALTNARKCMSSNLLKSSIVVSSMTLISRVLGLVRDVVIADLVGAGLYADVFLLAQKIPNFMRRLFAEGAFAQAFVPVLNEVITASKKAHNPDATRYLIDRVAGTLGVILLLITAIGVLGSSALAHLFGAGFSGNEVKMPLLILMIKITFPYLMFISLTAFAGGILNSHNRFLVPAITPVFLNLSMIVAAIVVAPTLDLPVMALPWAVFIAGVVQLLFQIPFLWKLGVMPRPKWAWHDSKVQQILKLITPALFGVSVVQINLLLDSIIASFLVTGSISWLYYSDRLLEFPLGIFAIAIATVVLPGLSKKHAEKSSEAFSEMLNWAIKLVLMIGIPAAAAMLILAEPLMLTLFQRGEFSLSDAHFAAQSLIAYTIGLNFFMLIKILAPGYFSRQDTKTPVKIGLIAVAVNMIFNLALFSILGHVGLALATSISAATNAGLLYLILKRRGIYHGGSGWIKWWSQVVFATTAMVVFLIYFSPSLQQWRLGDLGFRVYWMGSLVIGGIFCYLIGLVLTGVRKRHFQHS
jgi:putative peptidoglycan lipid II flippase